MYSFDELPQCLILPERKDVMETAHRLNKENGITIILITHYMDEAATADKVYVIDDGKNCFKRSPAAHPL